jgi:hypothetical protein
MSVDPSNDVKRPALFTQAGCSTHRILPRTDPGHPIKTVQAIGKIRLDNLEALIQRFGTAEALAEKADTSPVYISMLRNCTVDKKTGRPREMGTAMARRMEKAAGMPAGWMDQAHDDLSPAAVTLAKLFDMIPAGPDRDKCAAMCQYLCAVTRAGKLPRAIEALQLLGIEAPPSDAPLQGQSSQSASDQRAQT